MLREVSADGQVGEPLDGRDPDDVIYDPDRNHLKIIVVGPPGDVINLMNLIRVWLEQFQL